MSDPVDPVGRLWLGALRAELDALVLRVEAQLKQHVAAVATAQEREHTALAQRAAALEARLQDTGHRLAEADREAARLRSELESRDRELAARDRELAVVQADLEALDRVRHAEREAAAQQAAELSATAARLEARLAELGQKVQTLDEQFAPERAFVVALEGARATSLFDAATQCLGQRVEATPACYGALKSRGLEGLLVQLTRERGRGTLRDALASEELAALRAMAEAADCRLIEVARGTRFSSHGMEKVGERSEPSEEGEVLECAMPGLRRADAQGSLVFPRVIVASG